MGGQEDNMDRRDLHSVLRLFAEIASSMNQEENARGPHYPGDAQDDGGSQPPGDGRTWRQAAAGEG
jgi:hypothetical protein